MIVDSSLLVGVVLAVQANFYQVKLDGKLVEAFRLGLGAESESGSEASAVLLLCTRRSRLKKIGQQVMVGDRVVVAEPDWAGGRGAISEVLPRQTELNRPPIANADQILLVFAIVDPDLEPIALSRFLVKAESTGLGVSLCLNKCDLVSLDQQQAWRDRLSKWGYDPVLISVETGAGLTLEVGAKHSGDKLSLETNVLSPNASPDADAGDKLPLETNVLYPNASPDADAGDKLLLETNVLYPNASPDSDSGDQLPLETNVLSPNASPSQGLYDQLKGKITVISGPSGVGKSSLINLLIPNINLRVGAISGKLGRGRHTTRHVELFELPGGGLLADTPGFNQPNLECEPEDLAPMFPEVRQRLAKGTCQFNDCLHRDEPNCVVRGDWERYQHYIEFLAEVSARSQALQNLGDAESSFKLKSKSDGKQKYEPKLESKKYRRINRRFEHQSLQQNMSQDHEEF